MIAAFLQVILFWPSVAAPAESKESAFRQVGTLDRFPKDARERLELLGKGLGTAAVPEKPTADEVSSLYNGTLIPISIPGVRQLWQIWNPNMGTSLRTFVVVRDLDSLEPTNWFEIRDPNSSGYVLARGGKSGVRNGGGDWMHAIDAEGKRLFLMDFGSKTLVVVDLKDFSQRYLWLGQFPNAGGFPGDSGARASGLSWDPVLGRLWATYGKPATVLDPFAQNFLVRLNPDAQGASPGAVLDGSKLLRGCRGPLPSNNAGTSNRYASKILRWKGSLYIPCHRDLANAAVAIFKIEEALDPVVAEELLVGPASEALSVLADEAAGRLHFITSDSQDWVFDSESKAFVGFVALGGGSFIGPSPTLSVGLDQKSGRLFLDSKNFGLGVVEARYTPVGQAKIFPEFATGGDADVPYEMLHLDPQTGRIFALNRGEAKDATFYRIFKAPPPAPPQTFPDPDQNTADMSEEAGLTVADFTGSAGGYGIRTLAAGGFVKAIPMVTFNPSRGSPSFIFTDDVNSKCGFTDREMAAGEVGNAKLSTRSARAEALGVFLDQQSQQNLKSPSQCDLEIYPIPSFKGIFGTVPQIGDALNSSLGRDWKPAYASCSVPGSDPAREQGSPPLGKASASCPADPEIFGQALSADALGTVEGPQLSGSGYSKITVYRDRTRGLVSRAESIARGLTFGIVDPSGIVDPNLTVSIDEVRSVAESWSKGRPRTAGSNRTVTISGVRGPAGTRCEKDCDIKEVIDVLNTVFVGRAYFQRPNHDGKLFNGSPKGAQSAVQKSEAQVASDRATAGEGRSEVAALEIITYNDTPPWGRARQIYQLAGVKTASTYNISKLSAGDDFGPDAFEEGTPEEFGDAALLEAPGAPLALGTECDTSLAGRIARLAGILWRNLKNAAAMGTVWLLFLAPLLLAGRRRWLRGIFPTGSLGGADAITLGMSPQAKKLAMVILALLMVGLVFSLISGNVANASEIASPSLATDCFGSGGVASAAKMLWRGIKEALGMGTVWLLLLSPLWIAGRRRFLRITSIPTT